MKIIRLIVLAFFALTVSGCTNYQDSSEAEAKYVVEHLVDFQGMIQYFSVTSGRPMLSIPDDPFIWESDPKLEPSGSFIHVAVYETKNQSFKLVFLDDSRPPKIVATKEFKHSAS